MDRWMEKNISLSLNENLTGTTQIWPRSRPGKRNGKKIRRQEGRWMRTFRSRLIERTCLSVILITKCGKKMCVQEKRANGWKFNWLESWFLVFSPSFPFFAFCCFHRWKKVKGEGRKSLSRINGWKYRKGDTRNRHLLLEIRQRISPDKMCFTFRFLSRVV